MLRITKKPPQLFRKNWKAASHPKKCVFQEQVLLHSVGHFSMVLLSSKLQCMTYRHSKATIQCVQHPWSHRYRSFGSRQTRIFTILHFVDPFFSDQFSKLWKFELLIKRKEFVATWLQLILLSALTTHKKFRKRFSYVPKIEKIQHQKTV